MNRLDLSVDIVSVEGITQIRTREEIFFVLDDTAHTIKSGFLSDGASLPRFFWRVFGQPFEHAYIRAAVIHDYLYRTQVCRRSEADALLYRMMRYSASIRAPFFYVGVRIFGWIAWENNKIRYGIK